MPQRAAWLKVIMLPAILCVGMLARNAVLSGWLFYPAPYGHLPVSWAVPENPISNADNSSSISVRSSYAILQAWARQPGSNCLHALDGGRWDWLPAWWEKNRQAMEMKLFGGGLIFLFFGLLFGLRRATDGFLLMATGITAANLLFWFFTAPDLRFGEGNIWLWFALTGTLCLSSFSVFRRALLASGIVVVSTLLITSGDWSWPPKATCWHIGNATEANLEYVQLQNGQKPPLCVWVPKGDDWAGDARLPGTPSPNNALRCRVPGDLRHGFYFPPTAGAAALKSVPR